jgi:serine/threonine-protein kinase
VTSRLSDSSILRFGTFELNVETGELRKAGARINLPPQPLRILALLANHQGELVTREEIQREVWGDKTFVDFERGLNFAIMKIRTALSDDADAPRYVETLPRRGYRFIAPVHKDGTHAAGGITAADGTSLRPLNDVAVPDEGLVEGSTGPAGPLSPLQPSIPSVSVEIGPSAGANGWVRDLSNLLKLIGGGRSDAVHTSYRTRRLWVLALGLAAILGVVVIRNDVLKAPSVPSATRFPVSVPEGDTLVGDDGLALSPNGRNVVYGAWHNGTRQLFLRALDQIEAVPIAGTKEGAFPFFSPDGQWIGFFADNALKKVPSTGGAVTTICPAGYRRGASWGRNGLIVFASSASPELMLVADTGGPPRPLTAMAQRGDQAAWPELTPDGRAVIYTIRPASLQIGRIVVRSVDSGLEHDLVQGTTPRLTATGHLVFARSGELWAVPFDDKRLIVTDSPVKVQEGVEVFGFGGGLALFSVARDGSLAHTTPGKAIVVTLDRSGRSEVLLNEPHSYLSEPEPSPYGDRLALAFNDRAGENPAIWIYELDRRQLRRLTLGHSWDTSPLWTPDGKRIVFSSDRMGGLGLFWTAADGSDGDLAQRLTSGPGRPRSWTQDGVLAFVNGGIISLLVNPTRKPDVFLQTPYPVWDADFSPDGQWLAHGSRESGRDEVYVCPFPAARGKSWKISSQGGFWARWSPDGKELFYLSPEFDLMVSAITFQPIFQAAQPRTLFKAAQRPGAGAGDAGYAVMHDGQHFVMLQPAGTPRQLQVTLNWVEDLKQHGLVR